MADDNPRLATVDESAQVGQCMAAFRDFLGDDTPADEQLIKGANHVLVNELAEFVVVGQPAHSYAQLRYIWSAWHLQEVCWVEDLFVAEEHRHRGLGRTIMEFVAEHARARGCKRLQLDANESNLPGIRLYESLGFTNLNPWWDGGRDLYWAKAL